MGSRSKWITEPEPRQTATAKGAVFSVGIMADAEGKWTFIEEAKTKMKETKGKKDSDQARDKSKCWAGFQLFLRASQQKTL